MNKLIIATILLISSNSFAQSGKNVTDDQISDKELRKVFKAFDVDGDGEIREKAFTAMWEHTGEMKRNPQGAAKSLNQEVEKVVKALNKKEKDTKVKARRETHHRALAELKLNAEINKAIEESEERFEKMVPTLFKKNITAPTPYQIIPSFLYNTLIKMVY